MNAHAISSMRSPQTIVGSKQQNVISDRNITFVQTTAATMCGQTDSRDQVLYTYVQYVLKSLSFGSKDCTKELKLECAYFLGQTS